MPLPEADTPPQWPRLHEEDSGPEHNVQSLSVKSHSPPLDLGVGVRGYVPPMSCVTESVTVASLSLLPYSKALMHSASKRHQHVPPIATPATTATSIADSADGILHQLLTVGLGLNWDTVTAAIRNSSADDRHPDTNDSTAITNVSGSETLATLKEKIQRRYLQLPRDSQVDLIAWLRHRLNSILRHLHTEDSAPTASLGPHSHAHAHAQQTQPQPSLGSPRTETHLLQRTTPVADNDAAHWMPLLALAQILRQCDPRVWKTATRDFPTADSINYLYLGLRRGYLDSYDFAREFLMRELDPSFWETNSESNDKGGAVKLFVDVIRRGDIEGLRLCLEALERTTCVNVADTTNNRDTALTRTEAVMEEKLHRDTRLLSTVLATVETDSDAVGDSLSSTQPHTATPRPYTTTRLHESPDTPLSARCQQALAMTRRELRHLQYELRVHKVVAKMNKCEAEMNYRYSDLLAARSQVVAAAAAMQEECRPTAGGLLGGESNGALSVNGGDAAQVNALDVDDLSSDSGSSAQTTWDLDSTHGALLPSEVSPEDSVGNGSPVRTPSVTEQVVLAEAWYDARKSQETEKTIAYLDIMKDLSLLFLQYGTATSPGSDGSDGKGDAAQYPVWDTVGKQRSAALPPFVVLCEAIAIYCTRYPIKAAAGIPWMAFQFLGHMHHALSPSPYSQQSDDDESHPTASALYHSQSFHRLAHRFRDQMTSVSGDAVKALIPLLDASIAELKAGNVTFEPPADTNYHFLRYPQFANLMQTYQRIKDEYVLGEISTLCASVRRFGQTPCCGQSTGGSLHDHHRLAMLTTVQTVGELVKHTFGSPNLSPACAAVFTALGVPLSTFQKCRNHLAHSRGAERLRVILKDVDFDALQSELSLLGDLSSAVVLQDEFYTDANSFNLSTSSGSSSTSGSASAGSDTSADGDTVGSPDSVSVEDVVVSEPLRHKLAQCGWSGLNGLFTVLDSSNTAKVGHEALFQTLSTAVSPTKKVSSASLYDAIVKERDNRQLTNLMSLSTLSRRHREQIKMIKEEDVDSDSDTTGPEYVQRRRREILDTVLESQPLSAWDRFQSFFQCAPGVVPKESVWTSTLKALDITSFTGKCRTGEFIGDGLKRTSLQLSGQKLNRTQKHFQRVEDSADTIELAEWMIGQMDSVLQACHDDAQRRSHTSQSNADVDVDVDVEAPQSSTATTRRRWYMRPTPPMPPTPAEPPVTTGVEAGGDTATQPVTSGVGLRAAIAQKFQRARESFSSNYSVSSRSASTSTASTASTAASRNVSVDNGVSVPADTHPHTQTQPQTQTHTHNRAQAQVAGGQSGVSLNDVVLDVPSDTPFQLNTRLESVLNDIIHQTSGPGAGTTARPPSTGDITDAIESTAAESEPSGSHLTTPRHQILAQYGVFSSPQVATRASTVTSA
eukprot:GFYU01001694.1.p1 GENE.GFYU01001694.1~~GFYU01001694.1.p1  ORF type:complete len:1412 (-),score=295.65 GFYU01001694.1:319-4554(-)